jgi:hypothetical protein
MKLPITPAILLFTGILAVTSPGCLKSDDGASGVDANGKAAAAAVPGKADPVASQAMTTATTALEKNDYDAAIAALMAAKQSAGTMSDQQAIQYRQSLMDASSKLLEASQTDPKAKEAYENLGRLMKGR